MSQIYPETETARRKERISMAREICLHRGENPNTVDRGGNEGWEKYEPLAGACIREAERLFSLRTSVRAQRSAVPDGYVLMPREATRAMTMAACDSLPSCEHVFGHAGEMLRNCYRKMVAVVDSSTDRTSK